MRLSEFDKFFLNLPPLDRREDFSLFWEASLSELGRIPMEPVYRENRERSDSNFTSYDVDYNGCLKSRIQGELLVPRAVSRPRLIIYIHDYNRLLFPERGLLDESFAYFFIKMRGHELTPEPGTDEQVSPGFMTDGIMDINSFYARSVYLDVNRTINMLRLNKSLDCSVMGVMGRGFGAAAAVFADVYSDRVGALVLDKPSFCNLPMSQNLSQGDTATEINGFISKNRGIKKRIKLNMTYFDAMNFSDLVTSPVLVSVGFRDTLAPPACVFSLFNHILTEKRIEVYPEGGNDAGGDELFRKSIVWLAETVRARD